MKYKKRGKKINMTQRFHSMFTSMCKTNTADTEKFVGANTGEGHKRDSMKNYRKASIKKYNKNLVICMVSNKQDTYLVLDANFLKKLIPEIRSGCRSAPKQIIFSWIIPKETIYSH